MIPIASCSVLTVYLVGDGVVRTSPKKLAPPEQVAAVKNLFRQGDYVGAYNYCKANPSPLTNVVRVGVSYLGDGQNMTETAMSEELAKENSNVQTKLSYLSVIGVCTPMIGLLGTVTGMMSAFSTLGTSGIGDPSALAGAIGEVLVATASGLFIAIPAFAFFYYLRNRAAGADAHDRGHGELALPQDALRAAPRRPHRRRGTLRRTRRTGCRPNRRPQALGTSAAHVHAADGIEAQTVSAQAPAV